MLVKSVDSQTWKGQPPDPGRQKKDLDRISMNQDTESKLYLHAGKIGG